MHLNILYISLIKFKNDEIRVLASSYFYIYKFKNTLIQRGFSKSPKCLHTKNSKFKLIRTLGVKKKTKRKENAICFDVNVSFGGRCDVSHGPDRTDRELYQSDSANNLWYCK